MNKLIGLVGFAVLSNISVAQAQPASAPFQYGPALSLPYSSRLNCSTEAGAAVLTISTGVYATRNKANYWTVVDWVNGQQALVSATTTHSQSGGGCMEWSRTKTVYAPYTSPNELASFQIIETESEMVGQDMTRCAGMGSASEHFELTKLGAQPVQLNCVPSSGSGLLTVTGEPK